MTKKKILTAVAATVAVTVIAVGISLFHMAYYDRKTPNFLDETELYVTPGMDAGALLDILAPHCRKSASLRRAFRELGVPRPGHYVVSTSHSSAYVARMLAFGWQTPVKLVLSGSIRSRDVLVSKIAAQMMADSSEVASALDDGMLLDSLGMRRNCLLAYFIPDTYELYWTDSAASVISRMKREYDSFWNGDRLSKAAALGLEPMEVSVVASIVTGETNHVPEMPAIAAVYLNRLRLGMKLQADPTVAYCFDYKPGRILNEHLKVDSPYNTYLYPGLPPGPICAPSKAALEAVLSPDSHSYLYFCASPDFDGTHRFASTYAEHLRNAREFHAALSRRQRDGA